MYAPPYHLGKRMKTDQTVQDYLRQVLAGEPDGDWPRPQDAGNFKREVAHAYHL